MKIEHLTFGGNSSIRYTDDIFPETIELLKDFQINSGDAVMPFPQTGFSVEMHLEEDWAVFAFVKNELVAITNVCCFSESGSLPALDLSAALAKESQMGPMKMPEQPAWIYSFMITPFILTHDELRIAGEVALYIFNALLLARQEGKK